MRKADIVSEISDKTGIEKTSVLSTVEAFMEIVRHSLIDGESIYLRGFGTFTVKMKAERVARNIKKNTTIIIPKRRVPLFRPSKSFTGALNNK
ncbi:MAG: HU family DNA-binding protein [Bacteroidaceae bacterium]|nr:HU family DNA-binding protein [Bacteroidaceae bacterium]